MSHFGVLVLAPAGTTRETAEAAVEPLLSRYDENLEVGDHEVECWCVGKTAESHGRGVAWTEERKERREFLRSEIRRVDKRLTDANPEVGIPWDDEDRRAAIATIERIDLREEIEQDRVAVNSAWEELFSSAEEIATEAKKSHPLYGLPDPDCEDCHGAGRHRSTSNEQGFWDWYTVGGRWTGVLVPEYDPSMDARNMATCWLCEGTGRRLPPSPAPDLLGLGEQHWDIGEDGRMPCNGCSSTGISRNFDNAEIDDDVMPVRDLPQGFDNSFYALITPDGIWHQRGRMGWFGMSNDDMDVETWRAYVRTEVAKHTDYVAVVVDCHI